MKKVFREITKEEFKTFLKSCPSKNYMQSVEMYERYQENNLESYLLGVVEGEKVLSAGLVSVAYQKSKNKIYSFSRGPLVDFKNNSKDFFLLLEKSRDFIKDKHGSLLEASPNLLVSEVSNDFKTKMKKIDYKYIGEHLQVKWTYSIDFSKIENLPTVKPRNEKSFNLEPELDEKVEQTLLQSFRRDHRVKIRQATTRHNLKVRELKPSEYDTLTKLLEESGKFQGFNPREQQFFEQMNKAFNGKAVAIIAELPDKTPVAVGFFIVYGDEVIYLSSGMNREHKQLGGQHLIQWAMIRYAYANGFKKYNFWGTNPDPNNGVFQFKQGFHGEIEESVGSYIAPLNLVGKLYLKKLRVVEHRY